MRLRTKRILCRILTLGRHWWEYYPGDAAYVRCRFCGKYPASMYTILKKMNAKRTRKRWEKVFGD